MENDKNYYQKLKKELIELIQKKEDERTQIIAFKVLTGLTIIPALIPFIVLTIMAIFNIPNTIILVHLFIIASFFISASVVFINETAKYNKLIKETEILIDNKVKEIEEELIKNNKNNSNEIKKSIENDFKNERKLELYELNEYKKIITSLLNKYDNKEEKSKVKVLKKDNKNT